MENTMLAAVLHAVGDLRYESVPVPACEADEVLVAVKYCGVCGSDVARVFSKGTYRFPTIPGHEISGIVEHDPKGELTGRRVSVFPLLPCGKCEMCRRQAYELCQNYDYYGSRRDGGYAEYLAVKRWNLVFLPDTISLEEGAMCEPAAVARHAVLRLKICPGDSVVISGAGPIGLLAAQWAMIMGAAKVYLFDIDKKKMDYALKQGFEAHTNGITVDAALEGTGHADALVRCLDAVKPQGRIVLMGNPAGAMDLPQQAYWGILRKELEITGTWNSGFAGEENDWTQAIEAMAAKQLNVMNVVSDILPLSQCHEAFRMLMDRETFTNRILLRVESS